MAIFANCDDHIILMIIGKNKGNPRFDTRGEPGG
jgi:hypothetical protein